MSAAVDAALADAGVDGAEIDRVFLTGGIVQVPAVRALVTGRFGRERIASGGELTSNAHGLARIEGRTIPPSGPRERPTLGPLSARRSTFGLKVV